MFILPVDQWRTWLVLPVLIGGTLVLGLQAQAASLPDDTVRAMPCRPTIACTADIVPPGVVELEIGYLFRKAPDGIQHGTPFLVKLTVVPWLQAQVGGNGVVFGSDETGHYRYFDDMMLGVKFHVFDQEDKVPSVSFSAMAAIPTAPQPGYVRTYKALFTGYLTKDFGWLHADFNLGFNALRIEADPQFQGWVALSFSTALGKYFGAMLEGYFFGPGGDVAPMDAGILFGPTWSPVTWLTVDAGADIGLVRSTRFVSAFFGLTVVPGRLWVPTVPQATPTSSPL